MKDLNGVIGRFKLSESGILAWFISTKKLKELGYFKQDDWEEAARRSRQRLTKRNVLNTLRYAVDDGFNAALHGRASGAVWAYRAVQDLCFVLEDGMDIWNDADYKYYGLPYFKAVATKYKLDNPIGTDTGREEKYGIPPGKEA